MSFYGEKRITEAASEKDSEVTNETSMRQLKEKGIKVLSLPSADLF